MREGKRMGQFLILPINQTQLTVGYKHPWYGTRYKNQIHYGVDAVHKKGKTYLYGCGDGKVVLRGHDHVLGNVLVVRYNDVIWRNGTVKDVVVRYYHLDRICVKLGEKVNTETLIAYYGRTGSQVSGSHIHYEVDYDVDFPQYTPCLKGHSNIMKASPKNYPDTTLNPTMIFRVKKTHPEYQTVTIKYPTSVDESDLDYLEME